jgi:hypothetical protein
MENKRIWKGDKVAGMAELCLESVEMLPACCRFVADVLPIKLLMINRVTDVATFSSCKIYAMKTGSNPDYESGRTYNHTVNPDLSGLHH